MSFIGAITADIVNKYIVNLDTEYNNEREGLDNAILPTSLNNDTETKDVVKSLDIVRNRNLKNYILLFVFAISLALIGKQIASCLNEPNPEYPPTSTDSEDGEDSISTGGAGGGAGGGASGEKSLY